MVTKQTIICAFVLRFVVGSVLRRRREEGAAHVGGRIDLRLVAPHSLSPICAILLRVPFGRSRSKDGGKQKSTHHAIFTLRSTEVRVILLTLKKSGFTALVARLTTHLFSRPTLVPQHISFVPRPVRALKHQRKRLSIVYFPFDSSPSGIILLAFGQR